MATWATVKNWTDHQHYRDRTPPWIKLHRDLLDDPDYHSLPVASRAILPMIWLLASENEGGRVRIDSAALAWRLRIASDEATEAVKPLIAAGFLECASGVLADCLQDARPEREGERETEAETEEKASRKRAAAPKKKNGPVPSDQDLTTAHDMWADLQARAPAHKPPNLDSWANVIRLMREQDGRTHDQIMDLWMWAGQDDFWCSNILSARKLRKHFDRLTMQRRRANNGKQRPNRYAESDRRTTEWIEQQRRDGQ